MESTPKDRQWNTDVSYLSSPISHGLNCRGCLGLSKWTNNISSVCHAAKRATVLLKTSICCSLGPFLILLQRFFYKLGRKMDEDKVCLVVRHRRGTQSREIWRELLREEQQLRCAVPYLGASNGIG